MSDKNNVSRRDFLKAAGIAGITSVLTTTTACGESPQSSPEEEKESQNINVQVPTRPFGKTGVQVSSLCLGGMFDIPTNQLILKKALDWGVTCWDTADCYGGGRSEEGIGKYFSKNPESRQKVFLVTKSDRRDPDGMTSLLDRSLKRMKTDYIDLYFLHAVRDINELNDQTKAWAEKAKAEKKIRFFGFSTHANMEDCMLAASGLGWIDGIMMTYNYRIMNKPKMVEAVKACKDAGIGLTAMKAQALRSSGSETPESTKLLDQFLKKGFTDCQAKLLSIWENKDIASICSQMPNLTILMSNVAAALQKPKLASLDKEMLEQYAQATCSGYCGGCASICEPAMSMYVPIADIMRSMMYYHSYGNYEMAKEVYANIPEEVRNRMANLDYTESEQRCPHRIPIGQIVREASDLLRA